MTNTNEKNKVVSWLRNRWMVIVTVVCVIGAIFTLTYAHEAAAEKARDKQMMRYIAPLAVNFAAAHFSELDTNGDGNIDPQELELASKRPWPKEEGTVVGAALSYLLVYEDLIGHSIGTSTGGIPPPLEGINREDLHSWPERIAQYQ
jgi:hypothetical protein